MESTNGNLPKFPSAEVSYTQCKGSTHTLLRRSLRQLKKAGATPGDMEQFAMEATADDYITMIKVMKKWLRLVDIPG